MTAEFRDAIRSAGLEPPDLIEPGKFHRFPGVGKGRGNDSGWCKLFPDCVGGIFGDFSQGFEATWQAKRERQYTKEEVAIFKRQVAETNAKAEEERKLKHLQAANSATMIWMTAQPVTEHPYLTLKGVGAHGAKIYNGALVIPVRDGKTLHSLQFIMADGEKLFLSGGRVTGCYHSIGNAPVDTLCIAEGFATAASIHEATGHPVAVAFNAGNLMLVAKAMRAKFPKLKIVMCADDDAATAGNPGVTAARAAAREIGAVLAIPAFGDTRQEAKVTDFNDLAQWSGLREVKDQIAATICRCEEIPLEQLIVQANRTIPAP